MQLTPIITECNYFCNNKNTNISEYTGHRNIGTIIDVHGYLLLTFGLQKNSMVDSILSKMCIFDLLRSKCVYLIC